MAIRIEAPARCGLGERHRALAGAAPRSDQAGEPEQSCGARRDPGSGKDGRRGRLPRGTAQDGGTGCGQGGAGGGRAAEQSSGQWRTTNWGWRAFDRDTCRIIEYFV